MGLRIRGLDKLQKELEQKINVFNAQFRLKLGQMARDLIYKRVKSGYGTTNLQPGNAKRARLKPLSKSYVEQRRKRKLGKFGSPGRSNLTLSGQMLDAILVQANARGIKVYIDNSKRDDGYTNAEIAEFVQKARPFFVLTQDELTVLVREIERELRTKTRR